MKKLYENEREAFSLVEVIIAIAVLAVLMIPTLMYFTNASLFATRGKESQRAEVAAQSVLEELEGYKTFEQIEGLTSPAPSPAPGETPVPDNGWKLDPSPSPEVANGVQLTKDIEEDGEQYKAYVTVNYDYTGGSGAQFNAYKVPDIKQVQKSSNVVAVEIDETDIAINELYGMLDSDDTTTRAKIKAEADRELHLDIKDVKENKNYCTARIWYKYTYDEKYTNVTIRSSQVAKKDLARIYIFYKPLRANIHKEKIFISVENGIFASKTEWQEKFDNLSIYYLLQEDASIVIPTDYGFNLTKDAGAASITDKNLFSNTKDFTNAEDGVASYHIPSAAQKRIAEITVQVYDASDVEKKNLRAEVKSAKGE